MGYSKVAAYLNCISVLESEERLLECKVANYPNLKQNEQRKVLNAFKKQAMILNKADNVFTPEELARTLNNGRKNNDKS